MRPRADTPKERQRLLQLLAKRPAQLHLPYSNKALIGMLDDGLATVTHRWNEEMASGKKYQCVTIAITEAGLGALQ